MKTIHRFFASITTVAAASLLAACGGGGDDTVAGNGAVVAGTADAYAGTWKAPCENTEEVTLAAAPAEVLKVSTTIALAKVSDTRLSAVYTWTYYRAGSNCTGTPVATQTNASPANTLVIDGTITVGGLAADKVTLTRGAIGGFASGGTININGVVYPGDYFTHTASGKELFRVTGNQLQMGGETVDAQGYPTTIDTTWGLTKL